MMSVHPEMVNQLIVDLETDLNCLTCDQHDYVLFTFLLNGLLFIVLHRGQYQANTSCFLTIITSCCSCTAHGT